MTGVLSEAVASVIERAVAGLGHDVCSVKKTESAQAGRRDTILTVTPANPRAAEITVHVDDDVALIDVTLGKGGFFEVKPRLDPASAVPDLDEVRALIYAGIRGRYRETVWMKGDEVVQSRATATIGTKVVPLHWRQLFSNPFRRALRKDFAYEPYESET